MGANHSDVLIVGGGICGLIAARRLIDKGIRTTLVDENEVPGGRLATQSIGGGWGDTGAQFFTVRSPEFKVEVDKWLAAGLIYEWSRGWSDGSLSDASPDGYPRYAARGGFAALAHALSVDLAISRATRLSSVTWTGQQWQAASISNQEWLSRSVVMTPPVPDALALLDQGSVFLPVGDRRELVSIQYAPALCGLFVIAGEVTINKPGAVQTPDAPISWIADNNQKGISPDATVLTVHAHPNESVRWWSRDNVAILKWMAHEVENWLAEGSRIVEERLVRWRYALPTSVHSSRCMTVRQPGPIVFAGDGFAGPRLEGAVLSGWAAADSVSDLLASV